MIALLPIVTAAAVLVGEIPEPRTPTNVHPPAVVVLDQLEDLYGPVTFDHLGHAGMADMGNGCAACHHNSPESTAHPACRECHPSGAPVSPTQPGLKGAYHRQCLSCHTEWNHRAACNTCHLPKEGLSAAPLHPLGDFHELVPVEPPMTIEFLAPREAPVITFHHKDHTRIYGLACADCHRDATCGECHDHTSNTSNTSLAAHTDLRSTCFGCHATQGSGDCRFCHDAAARPEEFDHAAVVGWALEPFHTGLTCENCHGAADTFASPSPNCYGCHSNSGIAGFDHAVIGPDRDCGECHGDAARMAATATQPHPAMDDGCTACHDTSVTENTCYLIQPEPALCLGCHDDVADCYEQAADRHGASESGHECTTCHKPHGSNSPMLLACDSEQLCLGCHNRDITANDGRVLASVSDRVDGCANVHGPAASGECTACHSPHGSENTRLLVAAYPAGFYAPLAENTYELCFGCHDRSLLTADPADGATGFRNGPTNLHAVHVDQERGRTCRACHDPHASDLPCLIREMVPFQTDSWSFPMGYERTTDGGRCAPACHEPLEYHRTEVVVGLDAPDRR